MSVSQKQRCEWGEQLVALGECLVSMGDAMREDDGILGPIASEGVANHLAALPLHIRELFLEYASDEAAAGHATDMRYLAAVQAEAA